MGNTKKYWKGLDELNDNPAFLKQRENEFNEYVPVDKFLSDTNAMEESSTSRRDFLKFLGFSVTAATLAACETPVTKVVPYVVKPEEVTPGVANWYASSYFDGHDYCSIIVKTREARPIKIEGNPFSKITMGGVNARVQASLLSLYDSDRFFGPVNGKGSEMTWDKADAAVKTGIENAVAAKKDVVLLSSTIISPTTKAAIAEFTGKYGAKHVTFDSISYSGMLMANKNSFGQAVIPTYNFDKASVIVSFGADFLTNWVSPIEIAKQYSKTRKISKEKKEMSKHIQFESILTVSGANADERHPVKPSEMGAYVTALYNKVAGGSLPVSKKINDQAVAETAKWLMDNKGKSLVVCGSNDVNIQLVVNAINQSLGNYGNTIDINTPNYSKQGIDEDFVKLVENMRSGNVGALIVYNCNPVYTAPAKLKFEEAFAKVATKVSLATRSDETTALCDVICPDHNFLESWNDHNPRKGHYSLQQPTITPLFAAPRFNGSRQAQQSILKWAGNDTDYHTYLSNNWKAMFNNAGDSLTYWNQSLHDGAMYVEGVGGTPAPARKDDAKHDHKAVAAAAPKKESKEESSDMPKIDLSAAAAKIAEAKGGEMEVEFYESTAMGNGVQANNPWLQELPDPITKITWDNYITMNPEDMKGKYNVLERFDQLEDEPDTAAVTVDGFTLQDLPVFPQPGQAMGTIGIALGYGRTNSGKAAQEVGVNVYKTVQWTNNSMQYTANATVAKGKGTHPIACTQTHHTMMGRDIVKETSLMAWMNDAGAGNEHETIIHKGKATDPTEVNLWDSFDRPGHKWGLAIDLNSCIGCGACVVSCSAENNVPVVGKTEVRRSREMHWIRIDRYYSSDMSKAVGKKEGKGKIETYREMEHPSTANPRVMFQPLMCQHCNHAPCETVCPVLATSHSGEGLNMMTYNRCVGTRYCANNCPFKVRRFNWFNYTGNKNFKDVNPAMDDIGRMVLNPDVVVRSRGVMEKCSMCVQRIQAGKLVAKTQGRKLVDGEIQTACSQSCPTNAIIFGDLNDANSEVSKWHANERNYKLLEETDVRPSVGYLTKVRNTVMEEEGEKAEKNEGEKKEEKKEEKEHS
ncbi:MAG TPA: TAT-variant-translocated molybdopterin oxidoreductase [Bacteroidia bacterium]|jgi:molybdopterin-containing oxidoreductase family iron-sulfur binding subunit|nr:TAT-variant-translocated molybdopterin oxidoreductase [Bacteroidia bacterium]